ncbi:hypothetical protein F5878DRAFT_569007 [Lentinula raphanica]|uniref:AB hydrolase-1 domain-containing protein n=1 Tax=Lentinula raphanica TaxID=153919 RepID=A0AA38P0I7_9AGAR|nr:hypothetical protein F5878DRAFT_569007 [Lentinula raphanica]
MPTFTLADETLKFYYNDSGVPNTAEYTTYFVVHGLAYHSGVFQHLLPVAHQHSHRMISINRRDYPDSTPYTQAELDIFARGTDEERYTLMINEGINLSLLLDGLINELGLPPKIVLVGWSLGVVYTLAMLASIASLPEAVQERLTRSVKKMVIWEPPAHGLGMEIPPGCYTPFIDDTIPFAEIPSVFVRWVALHFQHGDLSIRHDLSQLELSKVDLDQRPSPFSTTTDEDLAKITVLRPALVSDGYMISPAFALNVGRRLVQETLFDSEVRQRWGGDLGVWHLVGDKGPFTMHLATWYLKDMVDHELAEVAGEGREASKAAIRFSFVPGASHCFMWEDPEDAMKELELLD